MIGLFYTHPLSAPVSVDETTTSEVLRADYLGTITWQLSRLFMAAALALMTIARDICVFGDESQKTRTTTVGVSH